MVFTYLIKGIFTLILEIEIYENFFLKENKIHIENIGDGKRCGPLGAWKCDFLTFLEIMTITFHVAFASSRDWKKASSAFFIGQPFLIKRYTCDVCGHF